jgi:hypothetical protein
MDPILSFVTQPIMITLIAVLVFVTRVVFLARPLRSASRRLLLADTQALEEAQKSLDSHRRSLELARDEIEQNLGGARDGLRTYKGVLTSSIDNRRREMAAQKREYTALRDQKAYKDAKKLVKDALPHKTHRAPKTI